MKKLLILGVLLIPLASFASVDQNLRFGASGPEVVELQDFLIDKGFLADGNAIGYFGFLTKSAVMRYQSSVGLPSTAFAGPLTRERINSEIASEISIADQAEIKETGSVTSPSACSNGAVFNIFTGKRCDGSDLSAQITSLKQAVESQGRMIERLVPQAASTPVATTSSQTADETYKVVVTQTNPEMVINRDIYGKGSSMVAVFKVSVRSHAGITLKPTRDDFRIFFTNGSNEVQPSSWSVATNPNREFIENDKYTADETVITYTASISNAMVPESGDYHAVLKDVMWRDRTGKPETSPVNARTNSVNFLK